MYEANRNALDRAEALRLITQLSKRFFWGYNLDASTIRYCVGGSTSHWSNILYNNEIPTRTDLQSLRTVIEAESVEEIRSRSKFIRQATNTKQAVSKFSAKAPLKRRDGSTYAADEWRAADIALDKVFGAPLKAPWYRKQHALRA